MMATGLYYAPKLHYAIKGKVVKGGSVFVQDAEEQLAEEQSSSGTC